MIFIAQWMKIAAKVTRYKNSVTLEKFRLVKLETKLKQVDVMPSKAY